MTPRLAIQPLVQHDIDELEGLLRSEEVYRFIGGPPSSDDFQLGMSRAIAGPPPLRDTETWLNYGVRLQSSGVLIGRLEATVHDGVAEVAFLFGPGFWGKGYATEGLLWLHECLHVHPQRPSLWATTVTDNIRCQALLRRCGYVQVAPECAPSLLTYDAGDLIWSLTVQAHAPEKVQNR